MIKLFKIDEPELLKRNKDKWTDDYVRLISSNQKVPDSLKYKYRDSEIKKQILIETHDKCAYCESKVTHVCPGDVEHILPKTHRSDLIFEWTNLTLSCEECNRTRKNDYYDSSDPLINPYADNPDDHIIACGPFIFGKPGDRKGELTCEILELNRQTLFERRKERIESLYNLAIRYANERNAMLKEILKDQLLKESEGDNEYSFVVKKYLTDINVI